MRRIRRIGVLTSGGDASGMNAAIRAVVRTAADEGLEVLGVRDGYLGLMDGRFDPLDARDVGGIIQAAGTYLRTARAPEFVTEEGQRRAIAAMEAAGLDALVAIGGNGTLAGADALSRRGIPVVGIAGTIDNDVHGVDVALGVDTALNVALESIDRLRATASSHRRAMLVEVMGRECGYLALAAGVAGGAEVIVIPEVEVGPEDVTAEIRRMYDRGKTHAIVVVSEGAGCVPHLPGHLERADLGFAVRTTTLGHVQRGGVPTAFDRLLGTRLGAAAVRECVAGRTGVLVDVCQGRTVTTPLSEVIATTRELDRALLELAHVLAK
jgi:6-phosphofructokinase 1